ncbi:MAG: hypothetical protein IPJ19_18400 [Planctomycetes bacterium]|nr:hypothetical protein [Planctomycetota bacterium]
MILSHEHEFIFVKTHKTAGTSVEIALSAVCGPDDVITPVAPEDEEQRSALGFRGPQNTHVDGVLRYYNHMSARTIRSLVGEDVWKRYYKFCFERNPWDKVISSYYWEFQSEPRPTLAEFLRSNKARAASSFQLYSHEGAVLVDRVCLYEDMARELEALRQRLELPQLPELPRAKSRFRADRRHYSEVLGPEEQEAVAQLFAREIALLHYRFEPAVSR